MPSHFFIAYSGLIFSNKKFKCVLVKMQTNALLEVKNKA